MRSISTRGRIIFAAVALCLAAFGATLAASPSNVSAADSQLVWFDGSYQATATAYVMPTRVPIANFFSPVDYANGRFLWKLDVTNKPSSKAMLFQVCMWQHSPTANYRYETCSAEAALPISNEGTYYADLGSMSKWWKIAAGYNLSKAPDVVRFMIKDAGSKRLMMSSTCGSYCYTGGDIGSHVPISMRSSVILVPAGGSFQAPSNWAGCPAAWGGGCSGSGTTTTRPATTTTMPSTTTTRPAATTTTMPSTTTTRPAATTTTMPSTTTTRPAATTDKDVVVVAGTTNAIGDRPIVARLASLGWKVTVLDDDTITSAKFAGAELIVITSSVVPSKVPTWLATLPTPIVDSEAYTFSTLRLASRGSESPASKLDISSAASPVKGSLSGVVTAARTSAAFGSGTPVSSAVVVATIDGQPTKAAVFTIDTGRALTSGNAPARRVGFFFGYRTAETATPAAWTLFDNAVAWAAG